MNGKEKQRNATVTFSLPDRETYDRLLHYSKRRGFTSIGALARFSLYQYVNRYPLKDEKGCTSIEESKGEK